MCIRDSPSAAPTTSRRLRDRPRLHRARAVPKPSALRAPVSGQPPALESEFGLSQLSLSVAPGHRRE
eukprot:2766895-Alexandrium_andersonii.AAC.1